MVVRYSNYKHLIILHISHSSLRIRMRLIPQVLGKSADALLLMRARRMALRIRTRVSCLRCKEKKSKCSDSRPCTRCMKSSLQDCMINQSYALERSTSVGSSVQTGLCFPPLGWEIGTMLGSIPALAAFPRVMMQVISISVPNRMPFHIKTAIRF